MDRNKLKIVLGIATALFLIVAVVLFILGLSLDLALLPKIVLIIVSVLALALSVELGYFTYLLIDKNPNYFLYNPKTKRNISVQKLNFATVNSRMNRFLSKYATSEGKIWNDRVLDNPQIDIDKAYKPAVAYKLIFDLANFDNDAGWKCFVAASDATVVFICKGLAQNGDTEMASALNQLKTTKPLNMKHVRDYLVGNKKYIQRKFYRYIVDNIDLF